MLVTHCYECYSAEAVAKNKLKKGGLLDSREASHHGGESRPAVVPGNPHESLLISALIHVDFEIPPKGKLPEEIIAHFVKWVEMGAPDPRESGEVAASKGVDIHVPRANVTPCFSLPEFPTSSIDAKSVAEKDWSISHLLTADHQPCDHSILS